jgi:hypothetical protein
MKYIFLATLALLLAQSAFALLEDNIETASYEHESALNITPSFDEQSPSELALYGSEDQENFSDEEPVNNVVEINQEDL